MLIKRDSDGYDSGLHFGESSLTTPIKNMQTLWLRSTISGNIDYKTKNTNLHIYGM